MSIRAARRSGTIGESLLQRLEEADPTLAAADQEHVAGSELGRSGDRRSWGRSGPRPSGRPRGGPGPGRCSPRQRGLLRPSSPCVGLACEPRMPVLRRRCRGDRGSNREANEAKGSGSGTNSAPSTMTVGRTPPGTVGGEGGGSVPTSARQVLPRTCEPPQCSRASRTADTMDAQPCAEPSPSAGPRGRGRVQRADDASPTATAHRSSARAARCPGDAVGRSAQ